MCKQDMNELSGVCKALLQIEEGINKKVSKKVTCPLNRVGIYFIIVFFNTASRVAPISSLHLEQEKSLLHLLHEEQMSLELSMVVDRDFCRI